MRFTLVVLTVCVVFVATYVYLVDYFADKRKLKIVGGSHKIIIGEFDHTTRGTDNEYIVYNYNVNGKKYTRTLVDMPLYKTCHNNVAECSKMRFLVMYATEEPEESLVCLIPLEGITSVTDTTKIKQIAWLKHFSDKQIAQIFR
jgi:hypothetical protein